MGIKLPAKFATVIAAIIAIPMTNPKKGLPFQTATIPKIVIPVTAPVIKPVKISEMSTRMNDFSLSSLMARRRTATASDCVPAFPAVPVINEIKTAKILASLTSTSYLAIKVAVAIPKNNNVINHGKRRVEAFSGLSLTSSTLTPANPE